MAGSLHRLPPPLLTWIGDHVGRDSTKMRCSCWDLRASLGAVTTEKVLEWVCGWERAIAGDDLGATPVRCTLCRTRAKWRRMLRHRNSLDSVPAYVCPSCLQLELKMFMCGGTSIIPESQRERIMNRIPTPPYKAKNSSYPGVKQ